VSTPRVLVSNDCTPALGSHYHFKLVAVWLRITVAVARDNDDVHRLVARALTCSYDAHRRLVYLESISDYDTHGSLSQVATHARLSCKCGISLMEHVGEMKDKIDFGTELSNHNFDCFQKLCRCEEHVKASRQMFQELTVLALQLDLVCNPSAARRVFYGVLRRLRVHVSLHSYSHARNLTRFNPNLEFGTIIPGGASTRLHDPPLRCTGRVLTPASLYEMWPGRLVARN
jgi:hypothetical protein